MSVLHEHTSAAAAVQCIITAVLVLVSRIYVETSVLRVDLPAHVHKLVVDFRNSYHQ